MDDPVVELNVGGIIYAARLSTIRKEPGKLADMFSNGKLQNTSNSLILVVSLFLPQNSIVLVRVFVPSTATITLLWTILDNAIQFQGTKQAQ